MSNLFSQEQTPTLTPEEQLAQLQQQNAELQQQVDSQRSIEEIAESLRTPQAPEAPAPVTPAETSEPILAAPAGLSVEEVRKLVQEQAQSDAQAKIAGDNEQKVSDHFTKLYGDKAPEVMSNKLKELGMTQQAYLELSQRSPTAALQLVKEKEPAPQSIRPGSSIGSGFSSAPGPLELPEKSLLEGAKSSDVTAFFDKVKAEVHQKLNVTV